MPKLRQNSAGFTLIELIVVVAIIGILASIAYPAYLNYIRESRRADARAALSEVRLVQEKWRANNTTYGNNASLGYPKNSPSGYYSVNITANSGSAFTAAATPQGAQAGDTCTSSQLIINQNGPDLSSATKRTCWGQ